MSEMLLPENRSDETEKLKIANILLLKPERRCAGSA